MFQKLSVRITDELERKGVIKKGDKAICAYGLRQLFSTLVNIFTMLIIGFITGMIVEAIFFTIAYIPVRIYAGGYHASTPIRCWAVSAIMLFIVLSLIKYIPETYNNYITILSLISATIIIMLSPIEDTNKPLDEKERSVYHLRAIFFIIIEILLTIILYFLKFKVLANTLKMVWIMLCLMLIIGKLKNIFIYEKNKTKT